MTQTRIITSLHRLLETLETVEVVQLTKAKKVKKPKKEHLPRSSGYRVIRKHILDWD